MSLSNISTEAITAAFLATLLISLAPNLILFLFPNYAQNGGRGAALSLGQALAAGGLLGDVFLHTLPHTIMEGDSNNTVGQWVLIGFTTFLLFDLLVRSVNGGRHDHSHSGANTSHDHSHNHGTNKSDEKEDKVSSSTPTASIFNSTVILNLAADALHNFTDGLAIGASFASSSGSNDSVLALLKSRGGLASLSVLLHELPHELGDFAILVSNGMSKRQAIQAQFSTALAAFGGTLVGLVASTSIGHDVLIPFTAGGFVYLASVSILPEILEKQNVGVVLRILQVVAFGIGIAFMQLVAILEEMEGHDHGGHHHSHGHHHEHQHRELNHDHHEHVHQHHEYHDHEHHMDNHPGEL